MSRSFSLPRLCSIVVATAGLALAGPALPQTNPLEQDGTQPTPAPGTTPGNNPGVANPLVPGGGAPAQLPPIHVPEFIKPGARLIYNYTMTLEPKEPGKVIGTTDASTRQVDIVKVLPDRVLAHVTLNVASFNAAADYIVSGGTGSIATANDVNMGAALWRDVAVLKAFEPAENIEVSRGAWQVNNRQYQATLITIRGQDSTEMTAWDSGTGLMLTQSSAVGPFRKSGGQNNGLNRQTQFGLRFQTFRQLELPWQNKPLPAWVKTTDTLVYDGQYRMTVAPDAIVPFALTVKLDEVGDDYVIGQSITSYPKQQNGIAQPDEKRLMVAGPGSPNGYWLDPNTLANLEGGLIDTDPHLGHTIHYQVQQADGGQVGVVSQTSRNGNQTVIHAYRLNDGALVYSSISQREPGIFAEMRLRERTEKR